MIFDSEIDGSVTFNGLIVQGLDILDTLLDFHTVGFDNVECNNRLLGSCVGTCVELERSTMVWTDDYGHGGSRSAFGIW